MKLPKFRQLRDFLGQIIILWIVLIGVLILFIDNRLKMTELKTKLDKIDKQLYLKEITFQKRQKEFDEQVEKHRKQVESLQKDLN
jgi:hypothetical protein